MPRTEIDKNGRRVTYYEDGHIEGFSVITDSVVDNRPPEQRFADDPGGLVEHYEKMAGCRVDSDGFNNNAVAGLMGMMARALGKNPHGPEHDICAGIIIQHDLSPAGQREREGRAALAAMLTSGMDPADIHAMGNMLKGDDK